MLFYNGTHAESEKVGGWVSSRSGWLLELLTELINEPISAKHSLGCFQGFISEDDPSIRHQDSFNSLALSFALL